MSSFMRARRALLATLFVSGAIAALAMPSYADDGYVGTWNAVNAQRNVVKVVISNSTDGSGKQFIHAFGDCSPTPCDWGTVPIAGLDSVAGHPGMPAPPAVGTATFTTSFETTTMKVSGFESSPSGDTITVQTSTTFTDKSGRKPFTITETFKRAMLLIPRKPIIFPTTRPTATSM
jgi:hypothetical protein